MPDDTTSDSSRAPLESLYRAAQLVTTSPDEADRLVRRVIESNAAVEHIDAARLMAEELSASDPRRSESSGIREERTERSDTVTRAVIRQDIERRIPDALASLDPARRIRLAAAVWRSADGESEGNSDISPSERAASDAFVRLVRARLPWRRTSLSDSEYDALVRDALRAFMDEHTEPVSPALESLARTTSGAAADEESLEESADRFLRRSRRFAAGLLLVVVAALLGTWLSTSNFQPEDEPPPRLFDAVMETADRPADFVLQTGDSGQAERYVRDRFGWNVVAPRIDGATLEGVESEEPVPGYVLPVLRYGQSGSGSDVRVFVIPYSVIQQMRGEITVDRAVLNQVADAGSFDVVRTESTLRVAWRHLDDVYVALVSSTATGFEDRISMP